MRMNSNDLAACAVIALGVGGVVVGSLLGVGNQAVTLPAVNPQPVVVDMPAEPEPGDRVKIRFRTKKEQNKIHIRYNFP